MRWRHRFDMDFATVLLIGVGLAMDAFAVSVCKGLAAKNPAAKHYLAVGLWFGGFQFIMPIIGYYLGSAFYDSVSSFAYVIAVALLLIIGLNMIREALTGDGEDADSDIGIWTMFVLAVATSIDAFAVGISLAMESANILPSALIIGIVTFIISTAGMKMGSAAGDIVGNKAGLLGGAILIIIAAKTALENLIL